jgi:hypothetical protein
VHVTDLVMVHVTKTVCADVIILPANSTVPGGDHIGVMRDGDGEDWDGVMMLIRRRIAIHNKWSNEYWSGISNNASNAVEMGVAQQFYR